MHSTSILRSLLDFLPRKKEEAASGCSPTSCCGSCTLPPLCSPLLLLPQAQPYGRLRPLPAFPTELQAQLTGPAPASLPPPTLSAAHISAALCLNPQPFQERSPSHIFFYMQGSPEFCYLFRIQRNLTSPQHPTGIHSIQLAADSCRFSILYLTQLFGVLHS